MSRLYNANVVIPTPIDVAEALRLHKLMRRSLMNGLSLFLEASDDG